MKKENDISEDLTIVPDALYPSDNEYGIPSLRLDMQALTCNAPVAIWGSGGRARPIKGTCLFYTEDYRFSRLWVDPNALLRTGCPIAGELNFSIYDDTPLAIAAYNVYRKRWVARYWQDNGVRIFVDLNVSARHRSLNLLGVPGGWNSFCTHGYSARVHLIEDELITARMISKRNDPLFVVYGGGRDVVRECQRLGVLHINERSNEVKNVKRVG